MPNLRQQSDRDSAMQALLDGVYAESSAPAVADRRRLIALMLSQWGDAVDPISPERVLKLAATLKAGKYRSSASVLSQYKVDAERKGQGVTAAVLRALTDAGRSCRRGQGPPIQSMALPFAKLHQLPPSPLAWARGGPTSPRNAVVVGGLVDDARG